MNAEDWQAVEAIATCVTAATVPVAATVWAWRKGVSNWVVTSRRAFKSILSREAAAAGGAWQALAEAPEVSLEAGIAYSRAAAQSGRPPYTPTQGRVSSEQPLEYLLAKTAETVWAAASAAQQDLDPYLVPVRNYLTALAEKRGLPQARDFALGILTERVRQEEDGWPDQLGDPGGKRTAHGTGNSHLCLLEVKHQVENALYAIGMPELLAREC